MSHCERRNGGEGEKKKIKKRPSPGDQRRLGGSHPRAGRMGAATIPWPWGPRGASVLPGHIVRGCVQRGQLLFGGDLASCVS